MQRANPARSIPRSALALALVLALALAHPAITTDDTPAAAAPPPPGTPHSTLEQATPHAVLASRPGQRAHALPAPADDSVPAVQTPAAARHDLTPANSDAAQNSSSTRLPQSPPARDRAPPAG